MALFLMLFPSGLSKRAFTFTSVNSCPLFCNASSINSPKVNAASIEVAKPPKAPAKPVAIAPYPRYEPAAAPPVKPVAVATRACSESKAVPIWVPKDWTSNSAISAGSLFTPLKKAVQEDPSSLYFFWNLSIRSDGT